MAASRESRTAQRIPLSRERVLSAAVALADESGLDALTMRRLADRLGAEAMSLYHHVPNKQALLHGIVEMVAGEINDVVDRLDLPSAGDAWKSAVRARVLAARAVLLRHSWAPGLLERSSANPAVLRYYDRLIGMMRDGGFSNELAHQALHALGSRALGFNQELFSPGDGADEAEAPTAELAAELPFLAGMLAEATHDDPASTLGWCDAQREFEFGLDLLLDGLDRLRLLHA